MSFLRNGPHFYLRLFVIVFKQTILWEPKIVKDAVNIWAHIILLLYP